MSKIGKVEVTDCSDDELELVLVLNHTALYLATKEKNTERIDELVGRLDSLMIEKRRRIRARHQ